MQMTYKNDLCTCVGVKETADAPASACRMDWTLLNLNRTVAQLVDCLGSLDFLELANGIYISRSDYTRIFERLKTFAKKYQEKWIWGDEFFS